jgi:hypothetical protein
MTVCRVKNGGVFGKGGILGGLRVRAIDNPKSPKISSAGAISINEKKAGYGKNRGTFLKGETTGFWWKVEDTSEWTSIKVDSRDLG